MDVLRALPEFAWAVLRCWQGYLTGGVLVAASSVWEHWSTRPIPWSKYKWGVITFLLVSFLSTWYDQRANGRQEHEVANKQRELLAARILAFDRERASLNDALEQSRHNVNVSSIAFQNALSVLRTFMSFRRAIGPDAHCWILVTAPQDVSALVGIVIPVAVAGANCPNGDLQNIGVKPEDVEEEMSKGMMPGVLVLHAVPGTAGADRLVDDIGNSIQTRRSYKMPRPVSAPANVIWLQFGTGTKWNSQLH